MPAGKERGFGTEAQGSRHRSLHRALQFPHAPTLGTSGLGCARSAMIELATEPDLRQLPLRSLLAYASRIARRVQPLYVLNPDQPQAETCCSAIERAVHLAEDVARGQNVDLGTVSHCEEETIGALLAARDAAAESEDLNVSAFVANAAYAVINAAKVVLEAEETSDLARKAEECVDSVTACLTAASAVEPDVQRAACIDWETLHGLCLGAFPELGEPVDPGESGVLGPLVSGEFESAGEHDEFAEASQSGNTHEPDEPIAVNTQSEIAELRRLKTDLEKELASLATERESLDAQWSEFAARQQAFQTEEQNLREELVSTREELSDLESRLQQQQKQFADQEAQLAARQEELQAQQEQLQAQQEQLQEERAAFQRDWAALEEARSGTGEDETGIVGRQRELDEFHAWLESERTAWEHKVEQWEAERDRLREERETFEAERDEFVKQREELAQQSGDLQSESQNVDEEREHVEQERQALESLKQDLDTKSKQLDAKSKELETKSNELEAKSEEQRVAEEEFRQRQQAVEAEHNELGQKTEELSAAEQDVERRRDELDRQFEDLRSQQQQLETDRAEWQTQQDELDKQRSDLQEKQQHLERGKQELSDAAKQLQQEREDLDRQSETLRSQREQIEADRTQLEQDRKQLQSEREEIEAARRQLQADQARLGEDQQALEASRSELDREQQRVQESSSRLDQERTELAELRARVEADQRDLEAGRNDLQASLERYQQDYDAFEDEHVAFLEEKAKFATKEAEVHKAMHRLQQLQRSLGKDDAKPSFEELRPLPTEDVDDLHAQIESLRRECEQLQSERTELQDRVVGLQTVLDERENDTGSAGDTRPARSAVVMPRPVRPRGGDTQLLRMIVDPGTTSSMQLAELFHEMSKLFRHIGGPGIRFEVRSGRRSRFEQESGAATCASSRDRMLLEVTGVPSAPPGSPSWDVDPDDWGQFLSSLLMVLNMNAELTDEFDRGEPAPKGHPARKLVSDSAKRAFSAYAAHQDDVASWDTRDLPIDSVRWQLQRVDERLTALGSEQGLALELATPRELDEDQGQPPADGDGAEASSRDSAEKPRPSSRRSRFWRFLLPVAAVVAAIGVAGAVLWGRP